MLTRIFWQYSISFILFSLFLIGSLGFIDYIAVEMIKHLPESHDGDIELTFMFFGFLSIPFAAIGVLLAIFLAVLPTMATFSLSSFISTQVFMLSDDEKEDIGRRSRLQNRLILVGHGFLACFALLVFFTIFNPVRGWFTFLIISSFVPPIIYIVQAAIFYSLLSRMELIEHQQSNTVEMGAIYEVSYAKVDV